MALYMIVTTTCPQVRSGSVSMSGGERYPKGAKLITCARLADATPPTRLPHNYLQYVYLTIILIKYSRTMHN